MFFFNHFFSNESIFTCWFQYTANMRRYVFAVILLYSAFCSFASDKADWKSKVENPDYIHRAVKQVTDVIVYDIYSPPVASRIYAYISIAGYEAVVAGNPGFISFAGQLKNFQPLPPDASQLPHSSIVSAVQAILVIGKSMVNSENQVQRFHDDLLAEIKRSGIPENIYVNSINFGNQVAAHVLAWAAKDNFKQTRGMNRYALSESDDSWKPTPPAYMKAVEPHWSKMRTFVIDSAAQFKPKPAIPFSNARNSPFYKEANEVYVAGKTLTAEQREIASFWDCNPFKMNVNGHVMYATKKISPGGHWINITRLACKKVNADFVKTLEAYSLVSIALADAFISCWDEKYRSNVIRPETYINQYIDKDWTPLLQTPPFPEYTSGHSVVSKACAIILTKQFGENFSYADSTEVEFELPVRSYNSFMEAAEEMVVTFFVRFISRSIAL
jgi:hypothetical protein